MRMVRLLLSVVFCALVVVYINRPHDTQAFHAPRNSSHTALGPLEYLMATTVAFRQSLIGLAPTDAPGPNLPQIGTGGPDVLKAATMTDPAAAAAEMAGVEERIRNSPMAKMIGGVTVKQARAQNGARFVKIPD